VGGQGEAGILGRLFLKTKTRDRNDWKLGTVALTSRLPRTISM